MEDGEVAYWGEERLDRTAPEAPFPGAAWCYQEQQTMAQHQPIFPFKKLRAVHFPSFSDSHSHSRENYRVEKNCIFIAQN